jgi:CheY-like chemotaxis protein
LSTGVGKTVAPSVLEFPVLWVDDHEDAVASFKSTIEAWFTTNYTGADLRMEHAISAADALAKVKASYFDLLIVDYNLPDGQNGSDLVKELRNQGVYTDIIFYTRRAQMPPDVATEVSKGGFALVVPDRDLASTSQAVIKDRLERFGKVSFLRGIVISMFIEVESELNKFLMSYFEINEKRQDHFRSSIL